MEVVFDSKPFAEGRFRLAYHGTHCVHPSKLGQSCVVKENKESYVWKSSEWDTSLSIYDKAKSLAVAFNGKLKYRLIQYVDASVYRVTSSAQKHPKLNEYVLVEDYIPGEFTKWCNNYGYISPTSELMPAFMHWSWATSGGELMIADLQGVQTGSRYILTDPVLLSNTVGGGRYGCTDTGVEGMAMFFTRHACSLFCIGLPKPTPQDVLTTCSARLQVESICTSTAYSHELKIPLELKELMICIFPTIAERYKV